jgi:hypothetical protein
MAISPLSRSSVSHPSTLATPSTSPVAQQRCVKGPQQSSPLQKRLMSDGFDSPKNMKNVAGMDATVRMLTQVAELLEKSVRMLGSELGAGAPPVPGAAAPQQGGVPGAAAPQKGGMPDLGAPPSAQVAGPEGVSSPKGGQKGERTMTFVNDGTSPMTVQFTPNAGGQAIENRTLKPGETQTVSFPDGWSGNFRSTAGDGKAATLGEVAFNGGGNNTYYDVSYIEGANAAMTIQPESGGKLSGTTENLLAGAPDSIKAKDANGQTYGIKKTTTSNVLDGAVVDYYRNHVGADQGYVIPTDDASTLGTKDSHLVVHMKNLS